MIWENGIEIHIISYMERVASPGSMHDTGCLGLVHWDDPEGWKPGRELGGKRGGRLGSFSTGTFMHLLAGDFTEGRDAIEKLVKESNLIYLEIGFLP